MRKLRRTITIDKKEYEIFLGLKRVIYNSVTVYNIYMYPDNPNESRCKPTLIKNGFKNEREAISYGKKYVKDLYIAKLKA